MGDSLYLLGAKEGAEKVKSRKISALDWAESCISQIKKVDPFVHAWAYLNEKQILDQAARIDEKIKQSKQSDSLGPLCGVPVGVKDIFNTIDMPTSMGSPIWEGFTPGNDARTVFNLRQADAVIAGKTVTAEFAVHTPGKTANPHNPAYSPGTSSSGSAAAVASFMAPAALGTQTAGSIIRPASYCGVFGFKPSFGLIPRTGTLKTTDSIDTIGMFARDTDDLELLFNVLRTSGKDYPINNAKLNQSDNKTKPKRPWKLGVVSSSLWTWEKAAPYAKQELSDLVNLMSKEGFEVDELKLPNDFNEAHDIHGIIYDKTLSYYFKEEFKKHTLVSEIMYQIISRGQNISLDQYKQALEKQNRLSQLFDETLSDYDGLVTLSTAGQAPKWGDEDISDSCLIWTLCGAPAINLPFFKSPNRLPFGAQIVSRRYQDYRLLKLGKDLEELFLKRTDAIPSKSEALPIVLL